MRPLRTSAAGLMAVLPLLFSASATSADERLTVCSITINSDDEIATFRKTLPESRFDFVELTDPLETTPADGEPAWLERACRSGIRCDVMVVSGHFANTYAGSYGTTFAGESGLSVSLEDFERRSCNRSCPGLFADPLEVFLFGCRTLADSLVADPLPADDVDLLARHQVSPEAAQRIVEEVRYRGESTSNHARMEFVFAGVPRIYGFGDAAPVGKSVAPGVARYLRGRGDYADYLAKLRHSREQSERSLPDRALERAIGPSTLTATRGLAPNEPAYQQTARSCFLDDEQNPVLARLEHMSSLVQEPGFPAHLRAMESFFRRHDTAALGDAERAALERIRAHGPARVVMRELVERLENPVLRFEALIVARSIGWITEDERIALQGDVVRSLLRPPVYGDRRDLLCRMESDVAQRIGLRAADLATKIYEDEYGIQALGCLKPTDEEIHQRLSQSLFDPREWIARSTAFALQQIKPARVEVQLALAEQLDRPGEVARRSAAAALRELKPSDPRVLDAIRKHDPSFTIDWL